VERCLALLAGGGERGVIAKDLRLAEEGDREVGVSVVSVVASCCGFKGDSGGDAVEGVAGTLSFGVSAALLALFLLASLKLGLNFALKRILSECTKLMKSMRQVKVWCNMFRLFREWFKGLTWLC